jgi:methyl-accepting chemotaxis protein
MAREVGNIADQTNQIAFNAARADQGRHGVAIVAHHLGKLCSQFGDTSKRIGETTDAVNAAIASTLVASRQYGEQGGTTANYSRQAIEYVIKRFRGATTSLLESSRELREESQAVGQEITQVLASLQFQERVTQVLGLIRSDLEKLQRNFAQADTDRRHLPSPPSAPAHAIAGRHKANRRIASVTTDNEAALDNGQPADVRAPNSNAAA